MRIFVIMIMNWLKRSWRLNVEMMIFQVELIIEMHEHKTSKIMLKTSTMYTRMTTRTLLLCRMRILKLLRIPTVQLHKRDSLVLEDEVVVASVLRWIWRIVHRHNRAHHIYLSNNAVMDNNVTFQSGSCSVCDLRSRIKEWIPYDQWNEQMLYQIWYEWWELWQQTARKFCRYVNAENEFFDVPCEIDFREVLNKENLDYVLKVIKKTCPFCTEENLNKVIWQMISIEQKFSDVVPKEVR
jgi:hypothetical protein